MTSDPLLLRYREAIEEPPETAIHYDPEQRLAGVLTARGWTARLDLVGDDPKPTMITRVRRETTDDS